MSVFTSIEGPYSNHIGGAMTHPITGTVYFLVTFRLNSAGPYRLQVWEDAIPYGDPKLKREWVTGTEAAGPGPWGYGTCTWTPDGSLYVSAPGGVDSSAVKPAIHIEHDLFPPIPLGSGDPRVGALVSQLGAIGRQIAALEARPVDVSGLAGVSQRESGALEVNGDQHAYLDLSITGDIDYGLRLIRALAGNEIVSLTPLTIRTPNGVTVL